LRLKWEDSLTRLTPTRVVRLTLMSWLHTTERLLSPWLRPTRARWAVSVISTQATNSPKRIILVTGAIPRTRAIPLTGVTTLTGAIQPITTGTALLITSGITPNTLTSEYMFYHKLDHSNLLK
jgi:hypothetical protein